MWFDVDLSSIQGSIAKSVEEASRIIEEVNNYDILNLDALAEKESQLQQLEEDELEDEDEEDGEEELANEERSIARLAENGIGNNHDDNYSSDVLTTTTNNDSYVSSSTEPSPNNTNNSYNNNTNKTDKINSTTNSKTSKISQSKNASNTKGYLDDFEDWDTPVKKIPINPTNSNNNEVLNTIDENKSIHGSSETETTSKSGGEKINFVDDGDNDLTNNSISDSLNKTDVDNVFVLNSKQSIDSNENKKMNNTKYRTKKGAENNEISNSSDAVDSSIVNTNIECHDHDNVSAPGTASKAKKGKAKSKDKSKTKVRKPKPTSLDFFGFSDLGSQETSANSNPSNNQSANEPSLATTFFLFDNAYPEDGEAGGSYGQRIIHDDGFSAMTFTEGDFPIFSMDSDQTRSDFSTTTATILTNYDDNQAGNALANTTSEDTQGDDWTNAPSYFFNPFIVSSLTSSVLPETNGSTPTNNSTSNSESYYSFFDDITDQDLDDDPILRKILTANNSSTGTRNNSETTHQFPAIFYELGLLETGNRNPYDTSVHDSASGLLTSSPYASTNNSLSQSTQQSSRLNITRWQRLLGELYLMMTLIKDVVLRVYNYFAIALGVCQPVSLAPSSVSSSQGHQNNNNPSSSSSNLRARLRKRAIWIWQAISNVQGLTVLTGVLLLYSYVKFRRYGTDAGD